MKRMICLMAMIAMVLTVCGCQGKTPDAAANVHESLLPLYEQLIEKQNNEDSVSLSVEPTENTLADDCPVTTEFLSLLRLDKWEVLSEEPTAPPYSGQRVYLYEAENGISLSIGLWYGAVTDKGGAVQYYALPQETNGELVRAIRDYAHKAEDEIVDDERLTTDYLRTYLEEKQHENQSIKLFSTASANQIHYDIKVTQDVIDALRLEEWQPVSEEPTDWQVQYTHNLYDGVRLYIGKQYAAMVSEEEFVEFDEGNGAVEIVAKERDVQYFLLPQETVNEIAAAIDQYAQDETE